MCIRDRSSIPKYIGWWYPTPYIAGNNNRSTITNYYNNSTFWAPAKTGIYATSGTSEYYTMNNVTPGGITSQDPTIRMKTMAYHNFSTGNWETLSGGKGSAQGWGTTNGAVPDPLYALDDATIGFSPMTSLLYPYDQDRIEEIIDSAGRPTDTFGFPFHDKYKAGTDQNFDLSQYIDEPVILKGWELKLNVIPKGTGDYSFGGTWENGGNSFEGKYVGTGNVLYAGSLPSPIVLYEDCLLYTSDAADE